MGIVSNSDAFLTGHHISYCAVYFDQVLLASKMSNLVAKEPKEHAQKMIQNLQRVGNNFARRIQLVNHNAEKANLKIRPLPALPPDFYPWADKRHQEFLEFWPATHSGGCCFVIGHALGEIRNGIIIANLTLDFESHLGLDGSRQRAAIPSRIDEAFTRWKKALIIIEQNQSLSVEATSLLGTLCEGLQVQIKTSLTLMTLDGKQKTKCLPLNHKILQILGTAEMEIQEHLN